ncbi:MAG: fibrobacter succinogenes major paralogous domain-containing protein [Bacteroidales bacterium]
MMLLKLSIKLSCLLFLNSLDISAQNQDVVTDYEGNIYPVVKLGNQEWMGKNLRSARDANGNEIESFFYLNDSAYGPDYGRLYSWFSAMNGSFEEKTQGICPHGWHLPSDSDWKSLTDFLGGEEKAAEMLKGKPGFITALGGNYHPELQTFSYIDHQAYYWTSTSFTGTAAWMRNIGERNINVNRSTVTKKICFSVRCIKN